MADRPNWSRPRSDDERPTASRRRFLAGGAATVTAALAGCLDDSLDVGDETGDGPTTTPTFRETARGLVGEYIDDAAAEDMDALSAVVHSASVLDPDRWDGTDWEFDGSVYKAVDGFELEDVTTDVSVELLFEYPGIGIWFDRDELGTRIGSEDIAVVDVGAEPLTADQKDSWILATDDGEWRVFFVSSEARSTGSARESFEPPVVDEAHDVVESVTWDVERGSRASGTGAANERIGVRVALTETPGVEADTVRIETAVADAELEFYTEQDGPVSTSWAGNTGTIEAAAAGDRLVVTAVDGTEETVVHREHYRPGAEDDA
ncbi:hypothetical protein [Haloarchaeobius litoreus]|uniref:Tat (Twin-arginine translocation) pathway signal sequence n=1 Tax=Haloarchaeobius litoreus TaxID=755306 RepID=A0ABD6DNE7_9EURY|nr:hypothetical protein [Haloarchaeobius litoreus]